MAHAPRKILIAVGGSGGHLFPAQAFAAAYLKESKGELLFAGAKLSENRYFDKNTYPYRTIQSATPFGGVKKMVKSVFPLALGVKQSLALLKEFKPDYVVGFGSFHAFPLLMAAVLKKVPLILFESNRIPGKVSRLFSFYAEKTAVYFPEAAAFLKGNRVFVEMPMKYACISKEPKKAREFFGLHPERATLLVFGGSQGANFINECISKGVNALAFKDFQVIHLIGKEEGCENIASRYQRAGILACVKPFEERMDLAYQASTLAVTRCGAATLAELLTFKVPSLIIPYPHAAENHQLENAKFLQDVVGGSVYYEEKNIHPEQLMREIEDLLQPASPKREALEHALENFKTQHARQQLGDLLYGNE